jgi:predicted XRE-type DNA-binding protein
MIERSLRRTVLGTISSGNVFSDLGFRDPETELTKANAVIEIDEAIKRRGMARAAAAGILGMPLQALTDLMRGRTEPYTVDRLKELLRHLDEPKGVGSG